LEREWSSATTALARVGLNLIATMLQEVFAMRGIPNIGHERPLIDLS
jgi:hypothetical protein